MFCLKAAFILHRSSYRKYQKIVPSYHHLLRDVGYCLDLGFMRRPSTQHSGGLRFGGRSSNSTVRLLSFGVHTHNIRALRRRHTEYRTVEALGFWWRPRKSSRVYIVGLSPLFNIITYHPQQVTRATSSFRHTSKISLNPSLPTPLHKSMPPFIHPKIIFKLTWIRSIPKGWIERLV